jgi:phospholipase/lecithinase/hemolysin
LDLILGVVGQLASGRFQIMSMKMRAAAASLFLVFASSVVSASGISPTELVVFGDSLSDDGNAFLGSLGTAPGANYASASYGPLTVQYFTDGANTSPATAGPFGVWTDQLASKLGVAPLAPALLGGTDYAVGGAETGSNGLSYVGDQVADFAGGKTSVPSNALYTFWAGANDIEDGKSPTTAADNIERYIEGLGKLGAQNFLWVNLPPLGDTPEAKTANALVPGTSAALNMATMAFNSEWQTDLTTLQSLGLDVIGVNAYSLFEDIESDNTAGCTVKVSDPICFANVMSPAQGVSGANPNDYLFWDGQHPTTAAAALVADLAIAGLQPVPEPATGALAASAMLLAAAGMLVKRR